MTLLLPHKNVLLIAIVIFFGLMGATTPPIKQLLPASVPCEQTLTLAYDRFPPYQFITFYGELTGLDIELVKNILGHAKYCMDYIQLTSFEKTLENIKMGTAHIALGMSKVAQREEFSLFTVPYRTEDVGLFLKGAENLQKYQDKSLEQLLKEGFKVGTIRGQYYGKQFDELKELYKKQIFEVESYFDLIRLLITGEADGVMNDPIAMWAELSTQLTEQELSTIFMHPILVNKEDDRNIYIIVSKNAPDAPKIVAALNKGIRELIETGEHTKIMQKYFKNYKPIPEFSPTPK
ncbi:MAG: amino acid ABC transporter substrate-binding protein [Gammaproteobacteria bacterium]|nr:amino acid ABC transporter substrate-binding protein [Gammaproteobacteria bacterium]